MHSDAGLKTKKKQEEVRTHEQQTKEAITINEFNVIIIIKARFDSRMEVALFTFSQYFI